VHNLTLAAEHGLWPVARGTPLVAAGCPGLGAMLWLEEQSMR